jgi:DNA-directed RNA polymerase subunit RPC12/RpoP
MDLDPKDFVEYRCDVCDRLFSNRRGLYTHQRIHTNERLYQCRECDRTFVHVDSLNNHRRVHFVDGCGSNREELTRQYERVRQHAPVNLVNPPLPAENPPSLPPLPVIPQIGGILPENHEDEEAARTDELYHQHGRAIDSYYRSRRVVDILNIRIRDGIEEIRDPATAEYNRHITSRIKANASPGYILIH